jgi:hypothetical protein
MILCVVGNAFIELMNTYHVFDPNALNSWNQNWLNMWSSWMPDYGGSIVVKPIFKEKPPLKSKQDLCCVIMPFREPYETIFNWTVRPSYDT